MSNYITTKEEFKKIKQAWSRAVNAPEAKAEYIKCDEYRYDIPKGTFIEGWEQFGSSGSYHVRKGTGLYKKSGWMTADHGMVYNILRDKPIHTGFAPVTCKRKISIYESQWHNFYDTVRVIRNRVRIAKALVKDDNINNFYAKENGFLDKLKTLTGSKKKKEGTLQDWQRRNHTENMQKFLLPFDGAITYQMIAKIDDDALTLILGFDRHDKPSYLF